MTKETEQLTELQMLSDSASKLLEERFAYANDTQRNREVRHEVWIDFWNCFKVLVDEKNFNKETTEKITSLLQEEMARLQKLR